MALIGLGFRSISMSPAGIGPVKSMLLALDAGQLRTEMAKALEESGPDTRPMRELLTEFAENNAIPL